MGKGYELYQGTFTNKKEAERAKARLKKRYKGMGLYPVLRKGTRKGKAEYGLSLFRKTSCKLGR